MSITVKFVATTAKIVVRIERLSGEVEASTNYDHILGRGAGDPDMFGYPGEE